MEQNSNVIQQHKKADQERTVVAKKATIKAMQKCLGVVTEACKIAGIDRTTYYDWYKHDEDFARACDDCAEIALDFAESKLHKQIEDNVPTSTIFFLKTKGKKRGYIERVENDVTSNGQTLGVVVLPQRDIMPEKTPLDTE